MATSAATVKQINFLKQLTGKDYGDEELTATEASKKIEKALANKAGEVVDANLPPQPSNKVLPEHQKVIDDVTKERPDPTRKSIERQTSLKASAEIAVAKIRAGKETSLNEILSVAVAFESYLENGATVEKKK